jgi:hypothetical protein
MWAGGKYAVTEDLDVIAAYYHYIQDSFFGTATGGPPPAPAPSTRNAPGRSTRSLPLPIGGLHQSGMSMRGHVHASEWRIGLWLSPAQQHRSYGRVTLPLLKRGLAASLFLDRKQKN